jgi:hypothetical protein
LRNVGVFGGVAQNRHPGVGVGKLLGPDKIVDRNRQSEFQSWSRQVPTASFAMSTLMSGRAASVLRRQTVADQCPMLGFQK